MLSDGAPAVVQHPDLDATHLGLLLLVQHLAEDEDGDVVLAQLREDVVGDIEDLDPSDPERRLLEGLALGAVREAFTVLEVAARERPLTFFIILNVSS